MTRPRTCLFRPFRHSALLGVCRAAALAILPCALLSCATPPVPSPAAAGIALHPYPVQSDARKALAREYARVHYGIDDWRLAAPRMIVVHYTGTDSDAESLSVFRPDTLASSRTDIEAGGALNVGVHYVITKDGTVWSLLPETDMGRHTIGYNYVSLGIEMTGSSGSKLTDAQLASCAALVADIARRNPSIGYLCGHHEYMQAGRAHSVLYRELAKGFAPTVKSDPGPVFMAALRDRLRTAYGLELAD